MSAKTQKTGLDGGAERESFRVSACLLHAVLTCLRDLSFSSPSRRSESAYSTRISRKWQKA
jgi:hypothetical protein